VGGESVSSLLHFWRCEMDVGVIITTKVGNLEDIREISFIEVTTEEERDFVGLELMSFKKLEYKWETRE